MLVSIKFKFTVLLAQGIVGEFSCQAINLAGLGPKCTVQVNQKKLEWQIQAQLYYPGKAKAIFWQV